MPLMTEIREIEVASLRRAYLDREAKLQFLIDYMNSHGMLSEGSFTFPDGDTWEAS